MSAKVRCFVYSGMLGLPVASAGGGRAENAQWTLKQPYLGSETIEPDTVTAAATTSALTASAGVAMIRIEVENGKRVRFELTPRGQTTRVATQNSPVLYGEEHFEFGPGWVVSAIEDE